MTYGRKIDGEVATENLEKLFGKRFQFKVFGNQWKWAEQDDQVTGVSFLVHRLNETKHKILAHHLHLCYDIRIEVKSNLVNISMTITCKFQTQQIL